MNFNYNYTPTTGNIKVQNVVFGFDKFKGILTCEFDMRGFDPAGGDDIDVTLVVQGKTGNLSITEPDEMWKRHIVTLNLGTQLDLKDWATQSPVLTIYDADNTVCYTETGSIKIDLDPIEYDCEITNHPFGDDSTPLITFKLDDLSSSQSHAPVVKVGSSTSSGGCTRFFEDGTYIPGTTRFLNLNGVKFEDVSSTIKFEDTICGYSKFMNISSYQIAAPTMSSGVNEYTIDLQSQKA